MKKKNKIDFRALYFKNIPWYRKAEGKEMKKGRKNCANLPLDDLIFKIQF